MQAQQEANAMKMANEFMRMRSDNNNQHNMYNQPYGQQPYGYPQQPYGYPQQPYGYPQQPYAQPPVQQQAQQLPPPQVQPIIINNTMPKAKKPEPKTQTIIKEVVHESDDNDFYDIDGFYDDYNGNK